MTVDGLDEAQGLGREAGDELRDGLCGGHDAARIDALRRHAAVVGVLVGVEELAGSADADGRLEDNGGAGARIVENHADGRDEVRQVDGAVLLEQRGHRDEKVRRAAQLLLVGCERDVGQAFERWLQLVDALLRNVEADRLEDMAEFAEQRLAHESHADDADAGLDFLEVDRLAARSDAAQSRHDLNRAFATMRIRHDFLDLWGWQREDPKRDGEMNPTLYNDRLNGTP